MSWARCAVCGETFGGDRGFDRHRVNTTGKLGYDPEYDWRCGTEAELLAKGWRRDDRGWWHLPGSHPARPHGPRTVPQPEVV